MPIEYGLKVENTTGGVIIDSTYANHVYGGGGTVDIAEETISNQTSGKSFYNVATISFGATYDDPPLLLIKLGQASSGFTNCDENCDYGSDRHFNFQGFDIDGNGKYAGFKYNRTRTAYAHGNNFEYAWFIPANIVADPNDSYGLIVKNDSGDTVFHSGHRYLTIIDNLTFVGTGSQSSSLFYTSVTSGGSSWQTSWAYNTGGYFNKSGDRPNSIQYDNGFHGYKEDCYDTIDATKLSDAGATWDDVWFCINCMDNSIFESGGNTSSYREFVGGLLIWYGGSDRKLHISGSNGSYNEVIQGGNNDNPFTGYSPTYDQWTPQCGTLTIPVAIIRY